MLTMQADNEISKHSKRFWKRYCVFFSTNIFVWMKMILSIHKWGYTHSLLTCQRRVVPLSTTFTTSILHLVSNVSACDSTSFYLIPFLLRVQNDDTTKSRRILNGVLFVKMKELWRRRRNRERKPVSKVTNRELHNMRHENDVHFCDYRVHT